MFFYKNLKFLQGKMSYKDFAKLIGISTDTLKSYIYKRRSANIENLIIIFKALQELGYINTLDELVFKDLSEE